MKNKISKKQQRELTQITVNDTGGIIPNPRCEKHILLRM